MFSCLIAASTKLSAGKSGTLIPSLKDGTGLVKAEDEAGSLDLGEPDSLADLLSSLRVDTKKLSEKTKRRSCAFKLFRYLGGRKDRDKVVLVNWRMGRNLSQLICHLDTLHDRSAELLREEMMLLRECKDSSTAIGIAAAISNQTLCKKWDEIYRLWTQLGMLSYAIQVEKKAVPSAELFAGIIAETETSLRKLLQRASLFLKAVKILGEASNRTDLSQDQLQATNLLLERLHPSRISASCVQDVVVASTQLEDEVLVMGSVLGCGSYAAVQEVQAFGQRYALKLFKDDASFVREAALHLQLQHPHIVQVLGHVELKRDSDLKYGLLLELMEAGNLESYINKSKQRSGFAPPFSALVCVDMMLQIARGLKYLHSLQIIHRDVKPSNILLTRAPGSSPSGLLLKLADFGTAKTVECSDQAHTSKRGTGFYRAPEVMVPDRGGGDEFCARYTLKADVYSFGMTCYSILTGEVPFCETRGVDIKKIKGSWMKPGVRPSLPGYVNTLLGGVVQQCWSSNPEMRQCFQEICWELECIRCYLSGSTAIESSSKPTATQRGNLLLA
ncbi:light-sensor Protein kinase [Selaginella moellendorffii]|nr:light-sensor Protein kinase [Selaginella moellendorffii]|eukprot:XP_002983141.2 light-sensor Protein kinase [Selaginella moellendorffii]